MDQFLLENSDVISKLLVALCLGLIIGAERTLFHKEAGMKTYALVSLGSALFMMVAEAMSEKYLSLPGLSPSMLPAQIVVGIGFLGAGAIMLQNNRVLGLTTAGGLWVTAGIGMASGFGLFSMAVISTLLVLFILVVVYFLEKPIRDMNSGTPS